MERHPTILSGSMTDCTNEGGSIALKFMKQPSQSILCLFSLIATPLALAGLEVKETEETLQVMDGQTEVLTYHKAAVDPPEGIDPIFRRSGFIHPLRTPKGGVLTGIHPKDHYHHLGLWHAWVHTEFDGRKPDFWNLGTGTGLVRHTGVKAVGDGKDDQANFVVSQQQVAIFEDGKEVPVLDESLKISVRKMDERYVIDYILSQENITEKPLVLPTYRYGGPLAWRGPLDWDKKNSDYLTSEGKKRKDSHQSRANWVRVHGPTEAGVGSLVMMGHPENHDSPQRLRTWDDGKMFLCWTPVQEEGMTIKAGETVVWKFRLLAADGEMPEAEIGKWWEAFSEE